MKFPSRVERPLLTGVNEKRLPSNQRRRGCEVAARDGVPREAKLFPCMFSDQREPLRSFQPSASAAGIHTAMTPQTGPYGGFDMGLYLVSGSSLQDRM